jgi:late competence protein required for DNA uptake (superfamily II DNA/RNA helicase)
MTVTAESIDWEAAEQTPEAPAESQSPYPCERCGRARARYVVADLEEADTSLYCPACFFLTFGEVAMQLAQVTA